MKLHHIGIATYDIQEAKNFIYETHTVIKEKGPIWDPKLKANLMLFEINEGLSLEIVSGPVVSSLLKKNINLYHYCYAVKNLDKALSKLRSKGATLIRRPTPAILFENRLVCFLNTPIGIIELLEK